MHVHSLYCFLQPLLSFCSHTRPHHFSASYGHNSTPQQQSMPSSTHQPLSAKNPSNTTHRAINSNLHPSICPTIAATNPLLTLSVSPPPSPSASTLTATATHAPCLHTSASSFLTQLQPSSSQETSSSSPLAPPLPSTNCFCTRLCLTSSSTKLPLPTATPHLLLLPLCQPLLTPSHSFCHYTTPPCIQPLHTYGKSLTTSPHLHTITAMHLHSSLLATPQQHLLLLPSHCLTLLLTLYHHLHLQPTVQHYIRPCSRHAQPYQHAISPSALPSSF